MAIWGPKRPPTLHGPPRLRVHAFPYFCSAATSYQRAGVLKMACPLGAMPTPSRTQRRDSGTQNSPATQPRAPSSRLPGLGHRARLHPQSGSPSRRMRCGQREHSPSCGVADHRSWDCGVSPEHPLSLLGESEDLYSI